MVLRNIVLFVDKSLLDMLLKQRLYLVNLKVMGKTIANELLFIVAIAPG